MDTRPIGAAPVSSTAPARLSPAPVRQAVRTELATPVAVAAQAGTEQSRWKKAHPPENALPPGVAGLETSIDLDRETGDLIYKVIDPSTRETILQYPYESVLKLRAYVRASESTIKGTDDSSTSA